jgi:RHS repeat-associated protein
VAANNTTIPSDGIPNLTYETTNNRITTNGFAYDVAGNQTRAMGENGIWLNYEYDAANRLQVVKKDDGTYLQAFQFGSTNARLMSHDYVTNQATMIASVGGTTLAEYIEFTPLVMTWTKSYTYLGGSQLATITRTAQGGEQTEFNHPDRLGTRTITDQAAGTNYEQNTLPFGTALNAESSASLSKRFTSYERSTQTGLDYAINRTYDSKLGRFTQVDPIGMRAVSLVAPQTLNLYTYCGNDPINHTDPNGLFWGFFKNLFKWILVAVAVIVAVITIVGVLAAPATIAGILSAISAGASAASRVLSALGHRKAGLIFGLIAVATGFGSVIAGKMGAGNFASGDSRRDPSWFGTLNGVGAVANSFDGKRKKETPAQRRARLIKSSVDSALWRLANMTGCKEFIQEEFKSLDPATVLKKIYDDGNIQPNNLPAPPVAQSPPAGSGSGGTPTYLSDEWFDGKTVGNWVGFKGLNQTNARTLIILHELKHRVGTGHDTLADGTKRDDEYFHKGIAEKCFGVK